MANLLGGMWRQFCPEYHARNRQSVFHASSAAKIVDAIYFEQDESIVCQISLAKLWGFNYSLGKLCRFNEEVFIEVGGKLLNREYDRGFSCYLACAADV